MSNYCNSCNGNCTYNSRNCGSKCYGALGYLRNGRQNGSCTNNCGCLNNGCGNNGCGNNGCGAWGTWADCRECSGCSGSSIFYSGSCGCVNDNFSGSRNGNCSGNCNGHCNGCCGNCANCRERSGCGSCGCEAARQCGCYAAAEFVAYAPQNPASERSVVFSSDGDSGSSFSADHCGIHINQPGRYVAMYTFAASACENAATMLSMSLNGREMYASRSYVSPSVHVGSRTAMGQAVFCAQAGDVLNLDTSVALNIPQTGASCPLATIVIWKIN